MGNLLTLEAAARANSGLLGSPLNGADRLTAIETALLLDEAVLFGSGTGTATDAVSAGLIAPTGVTAAPNGTAGSTSYTYIVADVSNAGLSPTSVTNTTGNATLSVANANLIQFNSVQGHLYNIYRSASSGTPSTTGLLSSVIGTGSLMSFLDNGSISPTAAQIPLSNTTGGEVLSGPIHAATNFLGGGNVGLGGKATVNGAGNITYTAAQFLADILVRTGSTAPTDPTPTAAALVAGAGPGIRAGAMHRLELRNEGSGTLTLSAGAGVTLRAANTNTIVTVASRMFTIVFTTVTPGSEAVEVISGMASTF